MAISTFLRWILAAVFVFLNVFLMFTGFYMNAKAAAATQDMKTNNWDVKLANYTFWHLNESFWNNQNITQEMISFASQYGYWPLPMEKEKEILLQGYRTVLESVFYCWTVLGVWLYLMAAFGFGAIFLQSKIMLFVYKFLMILLLIVTVSFYFLNGEIHERLMTEDPAALLAQYKTNETFQLRMDKLQEVLECCGLKSASDFNDMGLDIPLSCCPYATGICDRRKSYSVGCEEIIQDLTASIVVGIPHAVIQCCIYHQVALLVLAFVECMW